MKRKSIVNFLQLGALVRYLLSMKEGDIISAGKEEQEVGRIFLKSGVEELLESLKEHGFFVTFNASGDLKRFYERVKEREIGDTITEEEADHLKDIMLSLEKTLIAEALNMDCFVPGGVNIRLDSLLREPETLFPKGVFEELPELARYDIKEACLCLAFGRYTASAYHVLRATEGVLGKLYCLIVRRKGDRVDPMTLGSITHDFKHSRRTKKPSGSMLENIDYIRRNFRNPTSHPEMVYEKEDAVMLFNLCVSAIDTVRKEKFWEA